MRRLMCVTGTVVLASLASGRLDAGTIVVTPGSMGAWAFYATDDSGIINTGTGTGEIVNGPAIPPLGTGSAHLQPPAGAGDQSVQLRLSGYAGTRIDALTELSYSTYATAWNGQQVPYVTIWLDLDGNGSRDDRLWFEPAYSEASAGNGNPSPQADVALNTWQTWDLLSGMWYSDNMPGPGSNAYTLGDYLLSNPDATIVEDAGQSIGGIRIASGFTGPGDTFNAYVDAFTIATAAGSTTYDFELSAGGSVPEPASLLAWSALGLIFGGSRRWRRRSTAE